MKQLLFVMALFVLIQVNVYSQPDSGELKTLVGNLDAAKGIKEYKELAPQFSALAETSSENWLPWYYAAYTNARIGWLLENNGEEIEPFANLAQEQIQKVIEVADTVTDKKKASEIYCVLSMINRARVFINPMTYGRKYGPVAGAYLRRALELDPVNPRALYLAGWEKQATPKMWGGDKQKALELLNKALKIFEEGNGTPDLPHWGKNETNEIIAKIK